MQIKKTDWIECPERVKVRAHSLTFKASKRCAVLYTLDKEGSLKLIRHNDTVSFLMLHTKEDRIIISKERMDIKFFSLKESINRKVGDVLVIEKKGERISFNGEDENIFEIENSAFLCSASFGFLIEPSDEEIVLEFY